ncbi:MAG: hypothetical protein AB9903_18805 [Vulcanimicrobiota bacterium]
MTSLSAGPAIESFLAKKSTTSQIEKLVAFSPKGGLPPAQAALPTVTGDTAISPAELTSCATGPVVL